MSGSKSVRRADKFWQWREAIWQLPPKFNDVKIKGSSKLFLLALADHANQSGECYPGQARLSDYCGVSKRQISTLTRKMETAGLITVERRGATLSNRYWLSPLLLNYLDEQGTQPDSEGYAPEGDRKFGVQHPEVIAHLTGSSAADDRKHTSAKPPRNAQKNTQPEPAPAREPSPSAPATVDFNINSRRGGGDENSILKASTRNAVIASLKKRGVGAASNLAAQYPPDRIEQNIAYFDSQRRQGQGLGPGALVHFIRTDQASVSRGDPGQFSYEEMLAYCDRNGGSHMMDTLFERVTPPGEEAFYVLRSHSTQQIAA